MLLVSACLAGFPCRYDGKCKPDPQIVELVRQGKALPVCPETLGGLPTPRLPAELTASGEDVLLGKGHARTQSGTDVTQMFIRGAQETLALCRLYNIRHAILKSKSPSCGQGRIYDGSFSGTLTCGDGVTTALLKQNGILTEQR